ncbi:hypothetical protein GYH30_022298 [Glycine max]|nr:hypothetical protein GYH30_022298 [Glycine max]
MLDKGIFHGADSSFSKYESMAKEKVEVFAIAGSNRFGVYGTDFGWGKPAKVEITSVDRGLTIGLAESKDGNGGVEVGLVLKKNVMDLFATLFRRGVSDEYPLPIPQLEDTDEFTTTKIIGVIIDGGQL